LSPRPTATTRRSRDFWSKRRALGTALLLACALPGPLCADDAAPIPPDGTRLTPLATAPDWARLEPYQETVTRREFTTRLENLYVGDSAALDAFWRYAAIDDAGITFYGDAARTLPRFHLRFAATAEVERPVRPWLPPPSTDPTRPLAGLVICLDPGHIGGDFAKMEERFFQVGDDRPVLEAELNLWACHRAAPLLEQAGARVVWAKTEQKPVTKLRPDDLHEAARLALLPPGHPAPALPPALFDEELRKEAEKLFYRTAEIEARAARVAELKPNLTLCVHCNAADWVPPGEPRFVPQSRIVVFVHGSYGAGEIAYEDERFGLVAKLLEQSAPIELAVAEAISQRLDAAWHLPSENYHDWNAVKKVGAHPYIYARNLLATRAYPGPVVFIEGPYMNADDFYPRIEAGDYDGERLIAGKMVPSLFAEYGQAIADGVIAWARGRQK